VPRAAELGVDVAIPFGKAVSHQTCRGNLAVEKYSSGLLLTIAGIKRGMAVGGHLATQPFHVFFVPRNISFNTQD
jgi:hypothetical protein